jgi:hypothetical protein
MINEKEELTLQTCMRIRKTGTAHMGDRGKTHDPEYIPNFFLHFSSFSGKKSRLDPRKI